MLRGTSRCFLTVKGPRIPPAGRTHCVLEPSRRGGCAAAVGAYRGRGPSPRDCPACLQAGAAGTPYTPHPPGPQCIWAAPQRFPVASVEGAWALNPELHARAGLAWTVLAPLGVSVLSPDDKLTLGLGSAGAKGASFLPLLALPGEWDSGPRWTLVKGATPGSGKAAASWRTRLCSFS